jgi:hypothetical protein
VGNYSLPRPVGRALHHRSVRKYHERSRQFLGKHTRVGKWWCRTYESIRQYARCRLFAKRIDADADGRWFGDGPLKDQAPLYAGLFTWPTNPQGVSMRMTNAVAPSNDISSSARRRMRAIPRC